MTAKTVCDDNNLIDLCVICQDEENKAEINCSKCVAKYCLNCLTEWLKDNHKCPYCRQESETFKDLLEEVNEDWMDITPIHFAGQIYYLEKYTNLVFSHHPMTIDDEDNTYCVGSYIEGTIQFFRRRIEYLMN